MATMKYLIFISVITFLTSCSSAQKLVERTTADNGKAIIHAMARVSRAITIVYLHDE